MSARLFQPGEVVQLKSGGEPMTVEEWDDDNQRYRCVWHEKSKLKRSDFAEVTLEKYDPPRPRAVPINW